MAAGIAERAAAPNAGSGELSVLLRQALVNRAAALARAGDLGGAAALLAPVEAAADLSALDLPALDLLARIRAQEGDYGSATRLWRRVLDRDPEHAGARVGLARLEKGEGFAWRRFGPAVAVLAGVLFVVAAVAHIDASIRRSSSQIRGWSGQLSAELRDEVKRSEAELETLRTRIDGLAAAVKALDRREEEFARQLGDTRAALAAGLGSGADPAKARIEALAAKLDSLAETEARLAADRRKADAELRAQLEALANRAPPAQAAPSAREQPEQP
jgi:hypothetical protein